MPARARQYARWQAGFRSALLGDFQSPAGGGALLLSVMVSVHAQRCVRGFRGFYLCVFDTESVVPAMAQRLPCSVSALAAVKAEISVFCFAAGPSSCLSGFMRNWEICCTIKPYAYQIVSYYITLAGISSDTA